MSRRVQELLNRKPSRWLKVSMKTFEQDITLLQETVKEQQKMLNEINQLCSDYRKGYVGEMTDSFLVDNVLTIMKCNECDIKEQK